MESAGPMIQASMQSRSSNLGSSINSQLQHSSDYSGGDDDFKMSSMSYESMRLLLERRDRDLLELREFADFERESFVSDLSEQQQRLTSHVDNKTATDISQASQQLFVELNKVTKLITDDNNVIIFVSAEIPLTSSIKHRLAHRIELDRFCLIPIRRHSREKSLLST